MELVALTLGFGLLARWMWSLHTENARLRSALADTELANEGLTEELDEWHAEAERSERVQLEYLN